MLKRFFLSTSLACYLCTLVTLSAAAQSAVVLTVEFERTAGEGPQKVEMTLNDLKALPNTSFETETNWTTGIQKFTGVLLTDLLTHFEIESGDIKFCAINDYSVSMNRNASTVEGALLAFLRNDRPMTARTNGPVWVVYNYDSDAAFQTEIIYSYSIWQLDRIVVSR